MTPEEHPKERQNSPRWIPPRGIHYESRLGRPNPYLLIWRTEDGKRKKQAFSEEADREAVARDLAEKRRLLGTAILDLSPAEMATWREFRRMFGDVDPIRMATEWRQYREGTGQGVSSRTVREAWQDYRKLRKAESPLARDTWLHTDKHVGERFVGAYGTMRLDALEAGHLRDWLARLKHSKTGEPMNNVTRNHHRTDVNTFLQRCLREGWINRNPCELVVPPKGNGNGEVSVIPVADAVKFFAANRDQPVAIRVAMEAFGGLRYSTAGRIGWEHINFEERGIEMPGALHKSGKRKFRQGHPENLWAWLALAKDKAHPVWSMTLRQYGFEKTRARMRAKVETPHNVWRHSFASYLLAKSKSLPTVVYLMQHRHTTTTEIYEGVAKEADAAVYFGIVPKGVSPPRRKKGGQTTPASRKE